MESEYIAYYQLSPEDTHCNIKLNLTFNSIGYKFGSFYNYPDFCS